MVLTDDTGVGNNADLSYNHLLIIMSFLTIMWYNVAELSILTYTYFKRHSGLYFWSLMISTWCIFLYGLGMMFKFYKVAPNAILNTTVMWIGWVGMVSGQSVVLYSRLHLITQGAWVRWIFVIIITDAVVVHPVTGVLTYLTNIPKNNGPYKGPYAVVEKLEVTIFFIQETALSLIYIYKTTTMLKAEGPLFQPDKNVRGRKGRQVLLHTIAMSVLIIMMDITILALEYAGIYDIQTAYKGAVYSVKLKMEFTILNQLMNLVQGKLNSSTPRSNTGPSKMHSQSHPNNTGSRFRNSFSRSGLKASTSNGAAGTKGDIGAGLYTAGAYAKMDDGIALGRYTKGDVVKTTEVRVETMDRVMEDVESGVSEGSKMDRRRSASSSEIQIIDHSRI